MDIITRLELIELIIKSIKESVKYFNGNKFDRGCDYASEHSAASIQDRCRIARRELLMIVKELDKCL